MQGKLGTEELGQTGGEEAPARLLAACDEIQRCRQEGRDGGPRGYKRTLLKDSARLSDLWYMAVKGGRDPNSVLEVPRFLGQ